MLSAWFVAVSNPGLMPGYRMGSGENILSKWHSTLGIDIRHAIPSISSNEREQQYSETWELGTPTGLWKTLLNWEVVLFLRSISVYWIILGTGVAVLNSQVVPISQVVLKTGFTVHLSYTYPAGFVGIITRHTSWIYVCAIHLVCVCFG